MTNDNYTRPSGESYRIADARHALEAASENIATATARSEEAQTAYHTAVNLIAKLEPERNELEAALHAAKDGAYREAWAAVPHKVEEIARERAADIERINADMAQLMTRLGPAYNGRLHGEGKARAAEAARKVAQIARDAAQRELDIALLADALAPHTELVERLLRRTKPEQFVELLRSAITPPAAKAAA